MIKLKKIIIEIKTEGQAFEQDSSLETARILKDLAYKLKTMARNRLMDINGNKVGDVEYHEDLDFVFERGEQH